MSYIKPPPAKLGRDHQRIVAQFLAGYAGASTRDTNLVAEGSWIMLEGGKSYKIPAEEVFVPDRFSGGAGDYRALLAPNSNGSYADHSHLRACFRFGAPGLAAAQDASDRDLSRAGFSYASRPLLTKPALDNLSNYLEVRLLEADGSPVSKRSMQTLVRVMNAMLPDSIGIAYNTKTRKCLLNGKPWDGLWCDPRILAAGIDSSVVGSEFISLPALA